jgi:guanylate kinase
MSGNLIIISSPSGGGKGTLINRVLETCPEITLSVSFTTRQIRPGEMDGREYFFVSKDEFERLIEEGAFLEYATVHGNYYGTSLSQVRTVMEQGKDIILEIDVQGAETIFSKMPEVVGIFILPPSYSVLENRLTRRGTEKQDEIAVRLENSFTEIEKYQLFRYSVVNDDIQRASDEIMGVIRAERSRTDRQLAVITDILRSFEEAKGSR